MEKLKEKNIQIVDQSGQSVLTQTTSPKSFTLLRYFFPSKPSGDSHDVKIEAQKTAPQEAQQKVPREEMDAIRSWVALEERIIHDYKERKEAPASQNSPQPSIPEPKVEGAPSGVRPTVIKPKLKLTVPVSDGKTDPFTSEKKKRILDSLLFSTQLITAPPQVAMPVSPIPSAKSKFWFRVMTLAMFLGWMGVAMLMFLYVQEHFSRQKTSVQFAEVRGGKKQLEHSYADLKSNLAKERDEIQRLNVHVRNITGDLRAAQVKAVAFDAMEKSYREELLKTTTRYEEQLDAMRKLVQVRDDVLQGLLSHSQTIDKLLTDGGLGTLITFVQKNVQENATEKNKPTSVSATAVPIPDGKVVMVNSRYEFIVIDLGSNQGARTGFMVGVSKNGRKMTTGKIERVYPTMSAVTVLDTNVLSDIQEGDEVTFLT